MQRTLLALGFALGPVLIVGACADDPGPEPTPSTTPRITIEPVDAPTDEPGPGATPFSKEAWRKETIRRFGPEREFTDGSKLDYVRVAEEICETEDRPDYADDSLQAYMVRTYCPHA